MSIFLCEVCRCQTDIFPVLINIMWELIRNTAAMKISPKVKAKSNLAELETKLKNVENLEIFLQDLLGSNLSEADFGFFEATHEKLQIYRAKIISMPTNFAFN